MAFAPQYLYDVFVSYAHADDTLDPGGQGWVSQLVGCLEVALRQRLGGTDDLKVYFDNRQLHANHHLDDLLTAARGSAVFLAIASRSYAVRDWTKNELDAFVRNANDTHRLFVVECLPLDAGEVYLAPLQDHRRISFWRVNAPHSQTPMPLSPTLDSQQFHSRVHDLAEQIRTQLNLLRKPPTVSGDRPLVATERASASPATPSKVVLLAQVTDDLEDEREQLRRYLEQYRVGLLPGAPYPQDGAKFREAFKQDLLRANLFVQLLGAYGGRAPPELPEGYTRAQYAFAAASGIDILQWRQPDLDLTAVSNIQLRELLSGEHVTAVGFVNFKAEVLARATRQPQPAIRPIQGALVFVNADRQDLDIAKEIQKEFLSYSFPTVIPALSGLAEEVRSDLEENLIDCDALVLVYGKTSALWVRSQLRLYNKMRAKRTVPPRVLAIYRGPPEDKQDIGFSLPDVREIDGRNPNAPLPVLPLIEMLKM